MYPMRTIQVSASPCRGCLQHNIVQAVLPQKQQQQQQQHLGSVALWSSQQRPRTLSQVPAGPLNSHRYIPCSSSSSSNKVVTHSSSSSTPSRTRINSSSSSSRRSSSSSSSTRRGVLLRSTLLPPLLLVGSYDATTIVNRILSGYGLPTLKPTKGFKPYDEFEDDYVFEYPKSWVGRRNSLRQGVYISDFQTADKVAVEVLVAPADGDIRTAAVAAAVIPPGRQEDATLNLPAQRLIKSAPATVDGQDYLYLEFPSETTTRSGYNIKRKNFVVAGVKKDKLYVLSASARSDQYNDEKKEMLQRIVQSFRLR